MNIIDIHREDTTLKVRLYSAFTLWIRKILENRLNSEITKLSLDMSQSKRIDSEGVIFLFRWQHSGKTLELKQPSSVLFEILEILELRETWEMDAARTDQVSK